MEATLEKTRQLHGVVGYFDGPDEILEAAKKVRAAGYVKVDAYTPFPVHGLAEELRQNDSLVPLIVFLAGVLGACGGMGLEWFVSNVDYPLNVGGRPYMSWPAFVPVAYECTILFASFGAVIGMLALNGLPRPHHPIFDVPGFDLATQDRFYLCIEAKDRLFDPDTASAFLRDAGASGVSVVED